MALNTKASRPANVSPPDEKKTLPSARFLSRLFKEKEEQGYSDLAHRENFLLVGMLMIVSAISLLFASRAPFTVDEYLVRFTDLSGSPRAIWNLLKTAPLSVDPPLYHFLTSYWLRIFGPSEFVTRLPSLVSYVLMSFLMYRFIRRYAD